MHLNLYFNSNAYLDIFNKRIFSKVTYLQRRFAQCIFIFNKKKKKNILKTSQRQHATCSNKDSYCVRNDDEISRYYRAHSPPKISIIVYLNRCRFSARSYSLHPLRKAAFLPCLLSRLIQYSPLSLSSLSKYNAVVR